MNRSLLLLLLFVLSVQQVSRAGSADRYALRADFSHELYAGNPYRVIFTNKSTDAITSYWEFGDGTTSSEKSPTHIFAGEGEYKVTLTVTHGAETAKVTVTITVSNDLTASFTASPEKGPYPLTVDLTSTDQGFITIRRWTITPSTGYTIVSGALNTANLKVRFDERGVYKVSLQVRDGVQTITSEEKTISVESKTSFEPKFEWSKPMVVNQPIVFTNRTEYACLTSEPATWAFGDFFTGAGNSVSHTFTAAGTYAVTMTVKDGCGRTVSKSAEIEVISSENAMFPAFLPDKADIRKGQTVTFYDYSTATAPVKIGYWLWYFEQAGNLQWNQVPNNRGSYDSYTSKRESVSFEYNTPGTYTVRLYVGASSPNPGPHMDTRIYVKDTPEPAPDYVDLALKNYSANDKVMQYAHLDKDIFAYQHGFNATASSKIEVYRKGSQGQSDWVASGYYSNQTDFNSGVFLRDFRLKDNRIMVQTRLKQTGNTTPCGYQFLTVGYGNSPIVASSAEQIPATLFDPVRSNQLEDRPTFNFFGDEAAVLQRETDGILYLYIVKKGATWSQATRTKIRLGGYLGKHGKVFMDQNAIIVHNGDGVSVIERSGSSWNTTPIAIYSIYAGVYFRDIGYANNTIIVATTPKYGTECPAYSKTEPVAFLYTKPSTGWVQGMQPTSNLYLDLETEVKPDTKVCNSFINTENIVGITDRFAMVRLKLQNGSNSVDRIFIYKQFDDVWRDTNQHYKIKTGVNEMRDEFEISNTDILHTYISNQYGLDEGKAEVHTLKDYCYAKAKHIEETFSISGKQADVSAGYIVLGGRGGTTSSATIQPGATINYIGNTTLKPGFKAAQGSTVTIRAVNCDNLYWPE